MPTRMKIAALLLALIATGTLAGPVDGLNTFTAGSPARASEVNANFNAVKTAVDDNHTRIGTLLTQLAALQAAVATLQTQSTAQQNTISTLQTQVAAQATTIANLQNSVSNVSQLNGVVRLTSTPGAPTVQFTGVNVQILNGQNSTATRNGVGNLIVGYDEVRTTGTSQCSIGINPITFAPISTEPACTAIGGLWALSHKSGSHNLILGSYNNYSRWGAAVFGTRNTSNYEFASVLGGTANRASAPGAVVSAGRDNWAYADNAVISGGRYNQATNLESAVVGGSGNFASGDYSAVLGGGGNQAAGTQSTVSGGTANTVLPGAISSSIAGGQNNQISGGNASIAGGDGNTASGTSSSVSGGNGNTAQGTRSTVGGGNGRTATTANGWRAGNLVESN